MTDTSSNRQIPRRSGTLLLGTDPSLAAAFRTLAGDFDHPVVEIIYNPTMKLIQPLWIKPHDLQRVFSILRRGPR